MNVQQSKNLISSSIPSRSSEVTDSGKKNESLYYRGLGHIVPVSYKGVGVDRSDYLEKARLRVPTRRLNDNKAVVSNHTKSTTNASKKPIPDVISKKNFRSIVKAAISNFNCGIKVDLENLWDKCSSLDESKTHEKHFNCRENFILTCIFSDSFFELIPFMKEKLGSMLLSDQPRLSDIKELLESMNDQMNFLHLAIAEDKFDLLKFLIKKIFSVKLDKKIDKITGEKIDVINCKDSHGKTLLYAALIKNNYDLVMFLINSNANVHCVSDNNENSLHAILSGYMLGKFNSDSLKIAKALLDKGVSLNAQEQITRFTPLHDLCLYLSYDKLSEQTPTITENIIGLLRYLDEGQFITQELLRLEDVDYNPLADYIMNACDNNPELKQLFPHLSSLLGSSTKPQVTLDEEISE